MPDKLTDTRRMCVHTMTTKPWSLAEAIDGSLAYSTAAHRKVNVRRLIFWGLMRE